MALLTSYAQNFEDLMLWRALGGIANGHYVDIGAQSPSTDSVSRLFFEQGWSGVHVEPVPSYSEQLRLARPGDMVVQAAVAERAGVLPFFQINGTGLSTSEAEVADAHRSRGFEVTDVLVPAMTLDDLLGNLPFEGVHWLKIDVEGSERPVLQGWRESPVRPWIVVVESTRPLTAEEDYEHWEALLVAKGYDFVYFDGLNRFYLWEQKIELAPAFRVGPNIFDGFSLSANSVFCSEVNLQYAKLEALLENERDHFLDSKRGQQQQVAELENEVSGLSQQYAQTQADMARLHEEKSSLQDDKITLQDDKIRLQDDKIRLQDDKIRLQDDKIRLQDDLRLKLVEIVRRDELISNMTRRLEAEESSRISVNARLEETAQLAHRWWVTAEQQRAELEAMKNSHSWRLTRPLRAARRHSSQVASTVVLGSKKVFRPLIGMAAAAALRFPAMKQILLPLFARNPQALERIRRIAVNDGLISVDKVVVPPKLGRAAKLRPAEGRSAQVLADLKRAMKSQGVGR